jgi:MFS family permease
MLQTFLSKHSIGKRDFLVIAILFISVFGWFYMTLPIFNGILEDLNPTFTENLAIWAAFYVSIIGTSILGTFLSNMVERRKFLCAWTILGIAISLVPALINTSSFEQVLVTSLLLGASFGLGVPSCLTYFAESTVVENRGTVGGITFLIANISAPLLASLFNPSDLVTFSVVFALLRGIGLIVCVGLKPENHESSTTEVSVASILRDRTFMLYFVAWSMFLLVDSLESGFVSPYLKLNMPNLLGSMDVIESLVAGLTIPIAGLLCDWIGRKKNVLVGFVALGAAYAIIGFAPTVDFSWYIYFLVDGVAWGIFSLVFILILWGDLAKMSDSKKYYTLGSIPFFLSSVIPSLLPQSVISEFSVYTAFSLAAFFLFVAVMPLVFAPETLPEKKMELRRLRNFAEEAQRAKEKYERKKGK